MVPFRFHCVPFVMFARFMCAERNLLSRYKGGGEFYSCEPLNRRENGGAFAVYSRLITTNCYPLIPQSYLSSSGLWCWVYGDAVLFVGFTSILQGDFG